MARKKKGPVAKFSLTTSRPRTNRKGETGSHTMEHVKRMRTPEALAKAAEARRTYVRPASITPLRSRLDGPLPMRLESLLLRHGPLAVTFLCDVIAGRVPGTSRQQQIDAATTILGLLVKLAGDQMSALGSVLNRLDLSQLSDSQLQALMTHEHDANAAVAALLNTLPVAEVTDVPKPA